MAVERKYVHAVAATLVAGVATYVFLGIVSRSLDDTAFDTFSIYWSLSLIIGFGLFLPIEQELSRLSASGDDPAETGRAALLVAGEIALALLAVLGLASPVLLAAGIGAETLVVAAALILVSAVQFTTRGTLLVMGRVGAYANVLIADSVLRVIAAAGVALAASLIDPTAAAFAIGLVLAILLAHLPPLHAVIGVERRDATLRARIRTAVIGLIAGAAAAQVLLNAAPILIAAADEGAGSAGAFQASFSMARVPLFVLVPLQGLLVAPLAAQVARGETSRMTRSMLRLAAFVLAGSVVGAAGGYLLGPWAIELVFGAGRALGAADVAMMVGGVGAHCGLVIGVQALIAAGLHRRATVTWLIAAAIFAGVYALTFSVWGAVDAAVVAFLVSSLAGWIVSLGFLFAAGRRHTSLVPDPKGAPDGR